MSHREETPCRVSLLADRGVLRVTGADAKTFLQGLLTNDMEKTDSGSAIHAGLLSPQGKILFDFFVVPSKGGYIIDAPKDALGDLAKRLSFYRLRADVAIDEAPDVAVAAAWGGAPTIPAGAIVYADPRLAELGMRALLPDDISVDDLACAAARAEDYHAHRIALGVPQGGRDYAYGDAFPHEALFDQLNGVDFKKGCYVGQEVVSRMEHRGTARKRIVPVVGDGPLESGIELMAGDLPAGEIGSVDGTRGLALLRLDRAAKAEAQGVPLRAGEVAITLHLPAFATFGLPAVESA
ncbi:folate-binding protein [Methyloceanibacter sp.]|uniref:CAF17-like 4Fe-4S cluster assembly/insertion protein YgfZ n=1 Tax=Methyloceanibacter sp. TaxID=1965321 RepID=UPI002BAEAFD4|nr:folate-binding protein [Methyloceanibacter sp.]HML90888.1 folate-binding protein [Methyloceanibacter sp.]